MHERAEGWGLQNSVVGAFETEEAEQLEQAEKEQRGPESTWLSTPDVEVEVAALVRKQTAELGLSERVTLDFD
jgi:hypothetical protein